MLDFKRVSFNQRFAIRTNNNRTGFLFHKKCCDTSPHPRLPVFAPFTPLAHGSALSLSSPWLTRQRCFASGSDIGALKTKSAPAPCIGFNLTAEQIEYQQLARKFTADEITPKAAHHDRTGEYPTEILQKVPASPLDRTPSDACSCGSWA
jgi:hypothetical protein